MNCCGGDKNSGDAQDGRGAGGNEGHKGINWVQIVALGLVALFLAGIFAGRH